jgi:hypothetical protein
MASKRRCGHCRKPGHTRTTCPELKSKARAPREIGHVMSVRKAIDAALVSYAVGLPAVRLPDQVTVAEAVLEYALGMLHEAHESAGLAWESILPRLVAVNSEWANEDRQELRDLAEDEAYDEEDYSCDDGDKNPGSGFAEGSPLGLLKEREY